MAELTDEDAALAGSLGAICAKAKKCDEFRAALEKVMRERDADRKRIYELEQEKKRRDKIPSDTAVRLASIQAKDALLREALNVNGVLVRWDALKAKIRKHLEGK